MTAPLSDSSGCCILLMFSGPLDQFFTPAVVIGQLQCQRSFRFLAYFLSCIRLLMVMLQSCTWWATSMLLRSKLLYMRSKPTALWRCVQLSSWQLICWMSTTLFGFSPIAICMIRVVVVLQNRHYPYSAISRQRQLLDLAPYTDCLRVFTYGIKFNKTSLTEMIWQQFETAEVTKLFVLYWCYARSQIR